MKDLLPVEECAVELCGLLVLVYCHFMFISRLYLTLVVHAWIQSLQDGWTTLMVASQEGQVECVKMLVNRGAEINMQKTVSGVIVHSVHAMQHPG